MESCAKAGTMVGQSELVADLIRCGVRDGMTLLVHTSLRSIGPINGEAEALLTAFQEVLGPKGTLVVPTFTPGNSLSSRIFRDRIRDLSAWGRFRYVCNMPGFEPERTMSEGVG